MSNRVHTFEFVDPSFVVGSDAVVCVARGAELRRLMSIGEIDAAFSGYASYRRMPWFTRYVGVWGRKNCARFRRFLRERGGEVVSVSERPSRLRLAMWKTHNTRAKVRVLPPRYDL
ncbi:MAG TPA: hypothetical protein VF637_12315 [Sphingomicrobium sp.]